MPSAIGVSMCDARKGICGGYMAFSMQDELTSDVIWLVSSGYNRYAAASNVVGQTVPDSGRMKGNRRVQTWPHCCFQA